MISILKMKLDSIKTTESFIINKHNFSDDISAKLVVTRTYEQDPRNQRRCIATYTAELKLIDELECDMLDTSFYVRTTVVGAFSCEDPNEDLSSESMHPAVMIQLLPHLRANMAASMASVGIPSYLIPNSFIPELT